MNKDQNNIWYLAGPMFQYNEDVKELARQAGLKIVDANVAVDRANAAEFAPEVTIKAEYAERALSANGDHVPSAAELLAARDQLQAHKEKLESLELTLNQRASDQDEREQALATREIALVEREQANKVEAQRLHTEAASLQAAKGASAAPASTEKPVKAGKPV